MSDPRRLLDRQLHEGLAELLRSAEHDAPSAAADNKRRIYSAAKAPLRTGGARAASSGALRNVAWIGIAAVIAVSASALMLRGSSPTSEATPPSRPVVASGVASGEPSVAAPVEVAPAALPAVPSLRVDELPAAMPPSRPSPTAPTGAPAAAEHRESTAESATEDELAKIYAAQSALTAKRPERTLELIAQYRSTFRAPRFGDEADALEVQALTALGRRDEARIKAERFVAAYPNSPYAQRVRSAAGLSGAVEH